MSGREHEKRHFVVRIAAASSAEQNSDGNGHCHVWKPNKIRRLP